jgi:hypothetical protein
MRSLIFTTEVSITIVTTRATITIRNFLLSKDFSFEISNFSYIVMRLDVRHKSFCMSAEDSVIDRMNQKAWFIAIPLLSVLIISFTLSPVLGSNSVNIFPPGGKPYGLSYSDHIENFWKWSLAIPAKENPINDPTGDKCANGQSNTNLSVFYLGFNNGGISERTCRVPAGKGLLIPVMQVEKSDKEAPNLSIEGLDKSAKKDQDSVNSLYLKIDDKEYKYENLTKYRTRTDAFEVVFPDNGIFGVLEGGVSKAVADGFYIITQPVTKGTHTIHFKSSLICPDPDCSDPNFVQDIKYNIIAE